MIALTVLEDIEVGEALPVGVKGTAADLAALAGATIAGRLSLNGGAAVERAGRWFGAPDAKGFIGVVPFPGSDVTGAGRIEGVVIITLAGQDWSPWKRRFATNANAHV